MGDEVVVAASHPGDRHTVVVREVEISEALACEAAVRYDDAPKVELGAVQRQVAVAALAHAPAELGTVASGPSTTTAAPRWRCSTAPSR
jgi:hypothetical protein